jgi:hypothetical protein
LKISFADSECKTQTENGWEQLKNDTEIGLVPILETPAAFHW